MTMAVLKELREALEQSGAEELVEKVDRACDELAEAYAAVTCAANIRAEDRTNPGVWEHAFAAVIQRAKTDHSKVIA